MFIDAEREVYLWLKAQDVADGRVWLTMPEAPRTFPAVLMQRIGGFPTYAGDEGRFQFDCFGNTLAEANALAYSLASLLDAVTTQDGGVIAGGRNQNLMSIRDPAAPYFRVMVEATLFVRSVNAD